MHRELKSVLILGATGSIGTNAIDVVKKNSQQYKIKALVSGRDANKLAHLALDLKPEMVGIFDETAAEELSRLLEGSDIEVLCGIDGINEIAGAGYDIVISAIVGCAGLAPTMRALDNCKVMGLANKESLVCAGHILTDKARQKNVKIVPVDSEHSAIFQCLEEHNSKQIDKIILTASGGPFRTKTLEEIKTATPEQALKHPNWSMGARISIDSATLANKGLEFIEACVLFPITPQQIEVVVHPQSIIHSMVNYKDSSTLAQLGMPDMRTPIAYAMSYPHRLNLNIPKLDLTQIATLTFEKPDLQRFPMLKIAMECMDMGMAARIIFNAADEISVAAFLNKQIGFLDIAKVTQSCLDNMKLESISTLADVLEMDSVVRNFALQTIAKLV